MTHDHAWPHRRRVSGLHLFSWSYLLANAWGWASPKPPCSPSGARIFYYTRLALLRLGWEPAIEPTTQPLPSAVVAAFLQTAPAIGNRLAAEFQRVAHVLADPVTEGTRLAAIHPAPQFAGLHELLAAQEALLLAPHDPLAHWETCWKALAHYPLPTLVVLLNPARVLVAPVARLEDTERVALRLLKDRLAQDARTRSWRIPPPEVYLYEEPFLHWFARSLFTQPWFGGLWQGLHPKDRPA